MASSKQVLHFLGRTAAKVFLFLIPIILWFIAIPMIYLALFSRPLTGEKKILIESLQIFPTKMEIEKIPGYKKGFFFEVIATAEPGGPNRFFYLSTNHATSEVNEPYFHTTAQRLYRKYGTNIQKASQWERTTKDGQFTSFGIIIFWSIFILISTLCLLAYEPILKAILRC